MTDTDELIAFTLKQYDEVEEAARAVEDRSPPWDGQWVADEDGNGIRTYNGHVLAYGHRHPLKPGLANHIARHDPASVLADIASKRRILAEIVDEANGLDDSLDLDRRVGERDLSTEPYLGDLLAKILAEAFASRDGYKETWRP